MKSKHVSESISRGYEELEVVENRKSTYLLHI